MEMDDLARMYRDGLSIRRIVARVPGSSYQVIRRVLLAEGVELRPRGGVPGPAPHGSPAAYRVGCRCPKCKAAGSAD